MSIKKVEKAYKNLEFLNSASARPLRILAEFYEPKSRIEKYNLVDTIVFFGSARIKSREESLIKLEKIRTEMPDSPEKEKLLRSAEVALKMSKYYEDAVELAEKLTKWSMGLSKEEKRFIVCSGGGPGIMEAANKGAVDAGGFSIGLNISLPFEQEPNPYLKPKNTFEFHYFFMRKFWFVYLAKALVVFPGGVGTMDELFEVLTLVQTEKTKKPMKILIYDETFWRKIVDFDTLADYGMISREDLDLFDFCNSVDEMYGKLTTFLTEKYLA